jgi:uncharacterized membrane protein
MYLALKLVHVVAVVLFLGNITTGLFWKAHADRSRDPRIIAHTVEGIIRSDRWFTVPGVVIIVVAGFGAAVVGRLPILRTAWILWSLVLFVVSGIAFMSRVVPLQRRMLALARSTADAAAFDWAGYRRLSLRWELWGGVALLTPVAALALMVLKPAW